MKALGIIGGIGSMLIGAKQAGFDILGNIEWRSYYHTGTFEHNFPGSFMVKRRKDLSGEQRRSLKGVDYLLSHPECGNYSLLAGQTSILSKAPEKKLQMDREKESKDIRLLIDNVKEFEPKFFIMDNLPVSLQVFSAKEWAEALPDYDLFFEWVWNGGYGNIQKHRNRLFVIGSQKKLDFIFKAGEMINEETVEDVIGDLLQKENPEINHVFKDKNANVDLSNIIPGRPLMVHEAAKLFLSIPPGQNPSYLSPSGEKKYKVGKVKIRWDGSSGTLDKGESHFHPITGWPLTCRERARIQGCPDDFIFIDVGLGSKMLKQTGKFMPVQFLRYASKQIMAHLKGEPFEASGKRFLPPNRYVNEAKDWYCENIKYKEQKKACKQCWIMECDKRLYGPAQLRLGFK